MLIHSVTPIESLTPQSSQQNLVTKPFEHGFMTGYDMPDGFMISSVMSTNPSVYLDDKYSPGKLYK